MGRGRCPRSFRGRSVTGLVPGRRDNPVAPDGIEKEYEEVVLGPYLAETSDLIGEVLGRWRRRGTEDAAGARSRTADGAAVDRAVSGPRPERRRRG